MRNFIFHFSFFILPSLFRRVFVHRTSRVETGAILRLAALVFLPFLIFLGLNQLFPLPFDKLNPPSSTLILDRNGALLRALLAPDQMWRIQAKRGDIEASLRKAVLAYEDRFFHYHYGVNPLSLVRAALDNFRAGKILRGGSTISMQLARLMQPKERTYLNKLKEIFRAFQLEWHYSKDEIFTFYINMAPYGGNLVGAGTASYFYFGKEVSQLSLGEAATLAVIPNSPNEYRPDLNSGRCQNARDKVLGSMLRTGRIDSTDFYEAVTEPVPDRLFSLPFLTPHLSGELHRNDNSFSILTTIDKEIQITAKKIIGQHMTPLRNFGITNAAAVVIENQSRDVLAMLGSADFFDATNQGQVNGATAPRSPGSALKPFVYALGLERGLITPQTLLEDIPVDYSGYTPVNYDERFRGPVTAEEALIGSLNVPAVNLFAGLGENGVYEFLKQAGISTLHQPREHYGLSLILGGCEVTLLDLTSLYSGLALGGEFRRPRFRLYESVPEGDRLLSKGTCYILTEILSQLRRPELPSVWQASTNLPKVAWKTGTSYGHRDAWSIGYTPQYTVGVWFGNFNARGVPHLVGAEVAGPAMFSILNTLEQKGQNRWFAEPVEVRSRQVCAVSGMPRSSACSTARNELYLPGISASQPCSFHKLVTIDLDTGMRLCSRCRLGRESEERIMLQWPARFAGWLARNNYPMDEIPEHFSGCRRTVAGSGPVITSPAANTSFRLRQGAAVRYQKILLEASVSNQTQEIFWFVNGKMLASVTPAERVFLAPVPGKHEILCLDDEGRSSKVVITVSSP